MAKLKSSFKNMFIVLTLICSGAAALLATMNEVTKGPIAMANEQKLNEAIGHVVPEFDNSPVNESYKVADVMGGDSLTIYPAKKGDEIVGYAIKTFSNNAFSGLIEIMVGLGPDNKILNYEVLYHSETPGLGSKMGLWFKTEDKPNQYVIGRDLSSSQLKVSNDGGEIDAITASTITSRAFLESVNRAFEAHKNSPQASNTAE